jgi:hypothetical protein
MRSLLLVESFDFLSPSSQYILVRLIPSCFRFSKMCLCQVSLLSRCSSRYLTSSPWGTCTLFILTGGAHFFRVMNVTWIDLDPFALILHLLNLLWIASSLVFIFCEAMVGPLFVVSTEVSSTKFAVADSDEGGKSAVCIRYNNGHRTLPWGTPALTEESSVYSVSNCTRK